MVRARQLSARMFRKRCQLITVAREQGACWRWNIMEGTFHLCYSLEQVSSDRLSTMAALGGSQGVIMMALLLF